MLELPIMWNIERNLLVYVISKKEGALKNVIIHLQAYTEEKEETTFCIYYGFRMFYDNDYSDQCVITERLKDQLPKNV